MRGRQGGAQCLIPTVAMGRRYDADVTEDAHLRVVVDTALLRRPHTGTARWVNGLLDALG